MVEKLGLVITFSILNSIVIIYGIFLIVYGKFCKRDNLLIEVNIFNNIYFILIIS